MRPCESFGGYGVSMLFLKKVFRAARVAAGFLRFTVMTRRMWSRPLDALRFFMAAHGQLGSLDEGYPFEFGGLCLIVRPTDWCAFSEVVLDDEYGFVESLLAGGAAPFVFDVGANIGLFSARVFKVRPDASVCSVEADPSTFEILERNSRVNPRCRWRVLHYAVWSKDGVVCFERTQSSTGGHVSESGAVEVAAITLQRLVADNGYGWIDLLKMDIEGAEEAVLTAGQAVLQKVGCVIVEIHPARCNAERVIAILRDSFDHLYSVPGRKSAKPLLVATRRKVPLSPMFQ